MLILDRLSPNHGPRGAAVDLLILHYTGMADAGAAVDRLCDPASRVSAHYLVDEGGMVWRLVPEERRAWHAGLSSWRGERDVNSVSIGVELVNPGHELGYRPFPEAQMAAVGTLCRAIVGRHAIPGWRVLGHSDVAPLRKRDPGELFDWARLARAGIGLWPDFAAAARAVPATLAETQAGLAAIGYEVPRTGALDDGTRAVIAAFQRHFRPRSCDGLPDGETRRRIARVAESVPDPERGV